MSQTIATRQALSRAGDLCEWHKAHYGQIVWIFGYREGYHSAYSGGHHVFKRSRVDEPDAIISLCSECHYKAEHAIIKKIDMVATLSRIVGVDLYHKYREFCKWDDEAWDKVYP